MWPAQQLYAEPCGAVSGHNGKVTVAAEWAPHQAHRSIRRIGRQRMCQIIECSTASSRKQSCRGDAPSKKFSSFTLFARTVSRGMHRSFSPSTWSRHCSPSQPQPGNDASTAPDKRKGWPQAQSTSRRGENGGKQLTRLLRRRWSAPIKVPGNIKTKNAGENWDTGLRSSDSFWRLSNFGGSPRPTRRR